MSPSTTSSASSRTSAFVAWGRLLRLSLAPTAAADIVAGAFCAAHYKPPWNLPWVPVLASLCVYHGGMALNDWADREQDSVTRPERPIPSGRIRAIAARHVAMLLLCTGPVLLLLIREYGSSLTLAVVALLAAFYNVKGRGPWIGPLLLAACRGGNLLAGMQLEGDRLAHGPYFAIVASYAGYVFFVSRLGRLEDAVDQRAGRAPSLYIGLAASMLLMPGLATWLLVDSEKWGFHVDSDLPRPAWIPSLCIGAAAALFLITRRALPAREWTRAEILPAMGTCLRFLLVASATIALAGGSKGPYTVGAAILLVGYPLAWGLRQVFPPS
jgi:4-hydroxybenzoate polyprenyltransferase